MEIFIPHLHEQTLTLDRWDCLGVRDIGSKQLDGQDMIVHDIHKLGLVLWLHEIVKETIWKSLECIVGWSEKSKWTRRNQCVCKVSRHHCRHENGKILVRSDELDNILVNWV